MLIVALPLLHLAAPPRSDAQLKLDIKVSIGHAGGGITFCWLNRKHNLTMAYLTNGFIAVADQYHRSQEMGKAIVTDKKALETP